MAESQSTDNRNQRVAGLSTKTALDKMNGRLLEAAYYPPFQHEVHNVTVRVPRRPYRFRCLKTSGACNQCHQAMLESDGAQEALASGQRSKNDTGCVPLCKSCSWQPHP